MTKTTKTENVTKMTVKEILETYPRISLKRFCDETKLCYQYVLKSSKKPIPNTVYDPTQTNYEEIQKIVNKRTELDISSIDWKSIEESVPQKSEPINQIEDFEIDTQFKIRQDDNVYKVVYKTETHIVFININAEVSTQPRVMNNDTFLHQSPRIKTSK